MLINGRDIKVAAIDFDGTLFTEDNFPEVGSPIWKNINIVKRMKQEGVQLILWTCREDKILEDAVEACKSVGIEFDAINQNLQWRIDMYGNDCRKIGADLYFDDKSMNRIDEFNGYFDPTIIKQRNLSFTPEVCQKCNNHPNNGGSGICFCILGSPIIS